MADTAYEIFALAMRYVYVVIGVVILLRALRWLRKDARAYRREMKALPDAGLIGEVVDLNTGKAQPLPREGTIGSARSCDICVKGEGVRRHHAMFSFEEGRGLLITPCLRCRMVMAGVELNSSAHALHGTQLEIGGTTLRVRLFAGLNVPHPMQFQPDAPENDASDEACADEDEAPFSFAAEQDGVPAPFDFENSAVGQPAPLPPESYAGHYDNDGQMTWQFAAYPVEEIRRAMADASAQPETEETEEAVAYQSPVRHRRGRRK